MLPIGSPAQSIDDSGASGDNPTASNPASMARIGSPPVEAPSWPPLPSASVQQDGVLPSVTVSGSAVAAVASPPEVPQQHQKRSKRPARAEAISSGGYNSSLIVLLWAMLVVAVCELAAPLC